MKAKTLMLLLAVAACGTPVERDFTMSGSALNVADAALRGGSPQVALHVVTGVLASSPDNAQALALQGDALTLLGRHDAAIGSFERALLLNSDTTRAKIGLGRLRLGTDPEEAERLFMDVLRTEPRETVALNNLGIARDLQGRHTDAQAAYRQALGLNPEMSAAQVNLALSMAMSGQGDRALPLIQPLASVPNASRKLRHDYAAVLAMSGRTAEAERILAVDLSPEEVRQALAEFATKARAAGEPAR